MRLLKKTASVAAAALLSLSVPGWAGGVKTGAVKSVSVVPGGTGAAGLATGTGGISAALAKPGGGVSLFGNIQSVQSVVPVEHTVAAAGAVSFSHKERSVEHFDFSPAQPGLAPEGGILLDSSRGDQLGAKTPVSDADGGPASLERMLKDPESVGLPATQVADMSASDAKSSGGLWMGRILGERTIPGSDGVLEASARSSRHDVLQGGLQPSISLAAASQTEEPRIDPESDAALRKPGLDDRMLDLVRDFQEEIHARGKSDRLGHLPWALRELLNQGGVVRYAYTYDTNTGEPLGGFYNAAEKTLYLNDMFLRSDSRLKGAVLASLLQQAYDHIAGRAAGTREASVRQIFARDAYLEGQDMVAMAESVDIGNVIEVDLFDGALKDRLEAASGVSSLERSFGKTVSVAQIMQENQEDLSLLERELADLEDQLRLFEGAADKNAGQYPKRIRVLKEKIGIKKGRIILAKKKLAMVEREKGADAETRSNIVTPLSISRKHSAHLDLGKLPTVRSKERAKIASELEPVVALVRKTITTSKDPDIRRLQYVVDTIEHLIAAGGHILFAPPGAGAAASFSPVTLDLIIGREFLKTHPALVAALMVHELTHAADYFGVPETVLIEPAGGASGLAGYFGLGAKPVAAQPAPASSWLQRPLTRETERNAFTNEAIFIGAFDPEEIGQSLDERNPVEEKAYKLVFHARTKYVEGETRLNAMISDSYRELFGAHISGLQTAQQNSIEVAGKRADILEAHAALSERAELTRQAVAAGEEARRGQLKNMEKAIAFYEAYLTLYDRQIAQMKLEQNPEELERRRHEASLLRAGGQGQAGHGASRPQS